MKVKNALQVRKLSEIRTNKARRKPELPRTMSADWILSRITGGEGFNSIPASQPKGRLQSLLKDYLCNYSDIFGVSLHPQITEYSDCSSTLAFTNWRLWEKVSITGRAGSATYY